MKMDYSIFDNGGIKASESITSSGSIEAQGVDAFFRGKNVDDITLESLDNSYPHDPAACLGFMTPAAFAFFLPAFMKIALENYETANAIPESVISRLLAIAEGQDNERRDAILNSYSREQLNGIAVFLKEMSDRYWHLYPQDDARKALENFWGHYKQG